MDKGIALKRAEGLLLVMETPKGAALSDLAWPVSCPVLGKTVHPFFATLLTFDLILHM